MAVFGGYETVRELYRSGLASAATARKVGADGGERFVVKHYQPFSLMADDRRREQEIETFLDAARAQRQVASSGARHWVAIHDVGTTADGGYFVADYHPRSVQHLVRGRVKLSGGGLHRILRAVVQGLIELKDACHRPHGNLKPSNILLSGGRDVAKARPMLTDPAGSDQLDAKTGDVPDLHAIGELIYQLVLHRTGRAMGGWPAPDSEEWRRLGKNGPQWRQLCNRLLNPNLAPGLLTFEDLAEDLDKLRERAAARSPKVLATGAIAALVVVGALVGLTVLSLGNGDDGPKGNFDPKVWRELCTEFGVWVEPLLGDYQNGRLRAWQADEHLRRDVLPLLQTIIDNIKVHNPRAIAGYYGGKLDYLAEHPTDSARSEDGDRQARAALATFRRLRGALSRPAPGRAGWPACGRLVDAAPQLRKREWDAPAEYIEGLVAFRRETITERVKAVLAASALLAQVEQRWGRVRRLQQVLVAWGQDDIRPLARFGEYVEDEVKSASAEGGAESLTRLLAKLNDLTADDGLPVQLAAFIEEPKPTAKPLDWPLVRKRTPFAVPAGGRMTDAAIRSGLTSLEKGDYRLKPDPRDAQWRAATQELFDGRGAAVRELVTEATGILAERDYQDVMKDAQRKELEQVRDASAGGYRQRLTQLKGSYARIVQAGTYNSDTRQEIDRLLSEVASGLTVLMDDIGADRQRVRGIRTRLEELAVGTLQKVKERLAKRGQVSPTGLAIVDEKWRAQRDALVKTESVAGDLQRKANRVEAFLVGLEGRFEHGPVVGSEHLRPWNTALVTTEADSRRQHAIESCLSFVTWQKVLAGQGDPAFDTVLNDQVAKLGQWRAGLAKVVPAFNRIQNALQGGYLLTETPPSWNAPLGQHVAEQQKQPGFAYAQKALAPILARLRALGQVAAATDARQLLQVFDDRHKQGHAEVARAAWRRLGQVATNWLTPASDPNQQVLKKEIDLSRDLAALYGLLGDPARKGALQQELAARAPRRWEIYFASRSDAAEIDQAIARMQDFGLDRARPEALSPLARFRLHMHAFRGAMSARPGRLADDDVKTSAAGLQAAIRKLPAAFAGRPDVAKLLQQLDEVRTAGDGGGADLSKVGPVLAGWRVAGQDANTVTYSGPKADQKLTFARVALPSGEGVFLGTTEVSVGLFLSVVAGSQKAGEVAELLRKYDPSVPDPREGPRVWVRADGEVSRSDSWLVDTPALGGVHYPQGKAPPDPEPRHPMQHVSLSAAIYFARLLACRLPTSGEWAAAYRADQKARSTTPYNLRDRTWQAQKQFATQKEVQGNAGPEFYPDAGIFWPGGMAYESRKEGKEATIVNQDDGVLWFAAVGSDPQRVFQHLVGNVAELVYEDANGLMGLKLPTADGVKQFVAAGRAKARVIGGSALSPPEVARDKAHPLGPRAAKQGTSDVGFRLAFRAGRERLQNRVRRLLGQMTNQGYLPAERPKPD